MPDETRPGGSAGGPLVPSQQLDRAALERVLARATELQAAGGEPSESMTEAQLIELGKEVGISAEAIRQAIAEERTRVALPEEGGTIASWFGPGVATASRVVRGRPADVLQLVDAWMQREEAMRPLRRFDDRLTWEARRDFQAQIQTNFNFGGRAYALRSANEVGATVVPIDADRVLVRLDADVSQGRRRSVVGSAVTAGGFVATGAGLVGFTTLVPEASLVVGTVVGTVWAGVGGVVSAAIAAAQRRKVRRAQLALEQILDRLERGEMKTTGATLLDFLVQRR
jgi:hypothetical protein